ncbi:unnamed protein product [Cylicostephanus goldi]|uniref:Uncharacterized protein n=1 Tax=Cylicostephanus goldi TaxID=71465 RepID=A0A3P6S6G8_CYLGO|nr:unnamed protein product [Cylicostephanus goldi]
MYQAQCSFSGYICESEAAAQTILHMQHVQVKKTLNDYLKTTSKRLKIIDAYMLYIFLTGIIQVMHFD